MSARTNFPRRQRGAAILIAMLIMTLVATLAAGMVWLQWRGIEVETAERARGQGEWLLNAALDWGNLILKSSIRNGHTEDDLTQPWATPLAETKLSSFLSADGTHSDDGGPEAFLTGQITDAQSKYNLYDLVIDPTQVRGEIVRLQKLCDAIGVSQQVAQQIASGFTESYSAQAASASAGAQPSATTASLMPREVGDLVWFGIDPKTVKQLEPFIEIIPLSGTTQVHINANTAPAEVLMAADESITRSVAEQMVQKRQQKPFMTPAEARTAGGIGATGNVANGTAQPAFTSLLDVQSSYFEIYGQLRYEQNVIRERSVIYRVNAGVVQVLRRERLPPDAPA